jgi:hypothetical protein
VCTNINTSMKRGSGFGQRGKEGRKGVDKRPWGDKGLDILGDGGKRSSLHTEGFVWVGLSARQIQGAHWGPSPQR